jgi:hypothetical protein
MLQQVVLDCLPDAAASRREDDDDELETFGSQRTIGFVDIGSLLAAFLAAVRQEFGDRLEAGVWDLSSVPNLGQELQRAWDERVGSVNVRTPVPLHLSGTRVCPHSSLRVPPHIPHTHMHTTHR